MQYNDTTNGNGLIQDCEYITGFGVGNISGSTALKKEFTHYINQWYYKVITMILESMDDWDWDDTTITSTRPVATRALVASQRDYAFSTASWTLIGKEGGSAVTSNVLTPLQISRVDVTYDGTNWTKALPIDSSQISIGQGNEANIDNSFSSTIPYYDLTANSILIYPMATSAQVSAGAKIRIEFIRDMTAFTTSDTTKTPGFDAAFHRMLSIGASFDWALINEKPVKNDLFALLQDYEARLKKYYARKDDYKIVMRTRTANYE